MSLYSQTRRYRARRNSVTPTLLKAIVKMFLQANIFTYVLIQELKCSEEHFGAKRPCEFLGKNSHSFLKFSAKMPANALRLRIFA